MSTDDAAGANVNEQNAVNGKDDSPDLNEAEKQRLNVQKSIELAYVEPECAEFVQNGGKCDLNALAAKGADGNDGDSDGDQQADTIGAQTQQSAMDSSSGHLVSHQNEVTASTELRNKPLYRIDPKKYCGLLRGYVRQDWHTVTIHEDVDELRANWVELFFDLIYVACIVHISQEVAYGLPDDGDDAHRRRRLAGGASTAEYGNTYEPYDAYDSEVCGANHWDYGFLITAFAQFALLLVAWRGQVLYTTRFVMEQIMDEMLKLAYMVCVLCMGAFIKDDEDYEKAFLASYAALHLVLILMHVKAALIPRTRAFAIGTVLHSILTLVLIVILETTLHGLCALDYAAIFFALFIWDSLQWYIVVPFAAKFFSSSPEERPNTPINVAHIAERYGLFIMLILGETLISLMGADLGDVNFADERTLIMVIFFIMTFLVAYCIARLYYDSQPPEEQIYQGSGNHALRMSVNRAVLYMNAHLFLFFGLLGLGIGVKLMSKHIDEEPTLLETGLSGYSLVLIIIALNLIRISHPNNTPWKIWALRGGLLLIMIIMPLLTGEVSPLVIYVVTFLCMVGQTLIDVEGRHKVKAEKKELREKRESARRKNPQNFFMRTSAIAKL